MSRTETIHPAGRRCPPVFRLGLTIAGLILFVSSAALAAVDLAWFDAHSGSRIKLEWKTGSEIDLSGFFVRRSEKQWKGAPEKYRRIEVEDTNGRRTLYISPGSDSVVGSTYDYWDAQVVPGKTYYYLLEAVDNRNHSDFHGPIKSVCTRKNR